MTRPLPLVIVQARVGSSRLPGKVLADLCGRPLLAWLLQRIRGAELTAGVVVATTVAREDDAIERLGQELRVPVHRGPVDDVLSRFRDVAAAAGAEAIARVSADSPLLDANAVDIVTRAYLASGADLVQNHRPADWPVGTAVEVLTTATLLRLDQSARSPSEREHVTIYAYEHPGEFTSEHVPAPATLRAPALRLCVDTPADLERVRSICENVDGALDLPLEAIVASARA
jgi:spore coat polysaccharide biosynthesis protein SpsF (cytidylyltransferase family)